MFFADPIAAFTNIAAALRPGGRLAMVVWQDREHNEWSLAIDAALGRPAPAEGRPDAFSLADPVVVRGLLDGAGFVDLAVSDVHAPVDYGPDVDSALAAVALLWGASDGEVERLRATLADHLTPDGVVFDAHSWLVTARLG